MEWKNILSIILTTVAIVGGLSVIGIVLYKLIVGV